MARRALGGTLRGDGSLARGCLMVLVVLLLNWRLLLLLMLLLRRGQRGLALRWRCQRSLLCLGNQRQRWLLLQRRRWQRRAPDARSWRCRERMRTGRLLRMLLLLLLVMRWRKGVHWRSSRGISRGLRCG